jgi:hypothetical protein
MKLLNILDELKTNVDTDKEIKAQMLHYIEYIVVNLTQKIIGFQRMGEEASTAFESYIANNQVAHDQTITQVDKLLQEERKEIKEVVVTINKLMMMAV